MVTFGAGCFWGTEKYFAKNFANKHIDSIKGTAVGFMNPDAEGLEKPTYDEVCQGITGHIEVAQVMYDSEKTTFEELARFFFTFHDPTTKDRQGNDAGSQYGSAIFCHSAEQLQISEKVKADLQNVLSNQSSNEQNFEERKVETLVCKATTFYAADDEH